MGRKYIRGHWESNRPAAKMCTETGWQEQQTLVSPVWLVNDVAVQLVFGSLRESLPVTDFIIGNARLPNYVFYSWEGVYCSGNHWEGIWKWKWRTWPNSVVFQKQISKCKPPKLTMWKANKLFFILSPFPPNKTKKKNLDKIKVTVRCSSQKILWNLRVHSVLDSELVK